MALDAASSEFFDNGTYVFKKSTGERKSADDMVKLGGAWRIGNLRPDSR